ncbi:hypothetical protein EVAR_46751_1 [Eumeta japonica]|uniref:RNA-directed DNA polymerase from mobile element jockey n=1 Tax=Eumeta variegata TaxID=151549 RepID=A0A4C2AB41_EUMVA|nr:hypothetical protein EVAR_46751_1 [Eumeta japonica]
MLSYNACGLASSILELEQCALEYSVDIILVQETFLKPKNPKCCKLNNYVQLRTDRQGAPKGGTALYYRQTLNCSPIDIPNKSRSHRLQINNVKPRGNNNNISLPTAEKELLRSDVETLFALGMPSSLWRSKFKSTQWRCNYTNANGRK